MATWFDWAMGNSTFESLPKHIKNTAQWKRYQTSMNAAETGVVNAKEKLKGVRQAAEEWAAEQLEEESNRAADDARHNALLAEGARNAKAEQKGGHRKRRHTRRRHRKRNIKTRRGRRRRRR